MPPSLVESDKVSMEGPFVHGPTLVKIDVDRIIIEAVIAKGLLNILLRG